MEFAPDLTNAALAGVDAADLRGRVAENERRLAGCRTAVPVVFIAESAVPAFAAAFIAAVRGRAQVFLCDPKWGAQEWWQVYELVTPDVVFGAVPESAQAKIESGKLKAEKQIPEPGTRNPERAGPAGTPNSKLETRNSQPKSAADFGWLMLPTGGTSGAVCFARHDWETIGAAVRGLQGHLGVSHLNSVGVLPLHHVSGFMPWMRAVLSGGQFLPWNSKALEAGEFPTLPPAPDGWLLSLVPTQLQRLLAVPAAVAWLRGFRTIFIGGGPAWPALLDEAGRHRLPVSLTYGMTETAALVAALTPGEFARGGRNCGRPLPHAKIVLRDGRITIHAKSLFRGYYPECEPRSSWRTEDLGSFDAGGRLKIEGRIGDLIITGGKKVAAAEVEAALRATGLLEDACVLGLPDAEWGQIVAAFYPGPAIDTSRVAEALRSQMAGYKLPKRWIAVADWPRNEQGKVNRARLREAVTETGGPDRPRTKL